MADLTTDDYIQAYCPPLYALATKDVYIEDAKGSISESYFGSLYAKALAYMAMHIYTKKVTRINSIGGLVTSITENRTTQKFYNSSSGSTYSSLKSTTYGEDLLDMIHKIGPSVTIGNPFVDLT